MQTNPCSSPLCSGIVKFVRTNGIPESQASTPQSDSKAGIEIIIGDAPPTADEIASQLNQLGINCISTEETATIVNTDGNDTLNENELIALDALLEERLYSDKEFMLTELARKDSEFNMFFLSPSLRDDREVMLAAIKHQGLAYNFASDRLKQDKELALEALKNDYPFSAIPPFLQNDRQIIQTALDCFENDFHTIEELKAAGIAIPPEIESRYEKIINDLQRLGLSPARFYDVQITSEIISNRDNLSIKDNRPVAVLVYMPESYDDSWVGTRFQELIEKGYRVIYFEAHNEQEFYSAIESDGKGKRISALEIGGHGRYDWINFGAYRPTTPEIRDDLFIDFSDEKEMKKRHLARHLTEDAVIILNSCSTCEGGETANNIAGMMKRVFPKAQIFAPTEEASDTFFHYIFDASNNIVGASFRDDKNITCTIK